MAKTNYTFEKRQKELAKKQKQEEKRQKKLAPHENTAADAPSADAAIPDDILHPPVDGAA